MALLLIRRPSRHAQEGLELSLREALQLGHSYIGTEHLLLGLLRQGDDSAVRVLNELGLEVLTFDPK